MEAIADALHHGVGEPGRRQLAEGLQALGDLPALALADKGASRSRGRRAVARLRRMAQGLQPEDLEDGAAPATQGDKRRRRTIATQDKMVRRIQRHLRNGSVSRAAKVLESEPLADMTHTRNLNALKKLHPDAPEPDPLDAPEAPLQVDVSLVQKVVEKVSAHHRGSAGGPTAWTYEMIVAAATASADCTRAVVTMVNLILSGKLPRDCFLLDSTLVGTQKPAGGIRPIAIGEAWYRFAMLCALVAVGRDIGMALAPLQVGVGTSGGVEAVAHAVRNALDTDPDHIALSLDIQNAFNSVCRKAVLQEVRAHAPSLLPVVQWAYGKPTNLHVLGAPDGTPPILSQTGVRQGDPLGPLLFALALQKPLRGALAAAPGAHGIAYLDDCTAVGKSSALRAFLKELDGTGPNSVRSIGLRIRKDKCGLYGGTGTACADLAAAVKLPHKPDGLTVVGVPIGTSAYQTQTVSARADKVTKLVDLLGTLTKLPLQSQWLLLSMSLNARMTHFMRVLPWNLIQGAMRRVDSHVHAAAASLFQLRQPLSDTARACLVAPIRHGGFGLTASEEPVARAAFLAGSALAQVIMADGPTAFQPFKGPKAADLRASWDVLHADFRDDCNWPPDAAPLRDQDVPVLLPHAQRLVTRAVADRRFAAAIATTAASTYEAKRDASRLRSSAGAPSGAWLLAMPRETTVMGNSAFRHAARHRLGEGAPQHLTPPACTCGHGLADRPDHAMVCVQCNKQSTLRHDNLACAVRRAAARTGAPTNRETGYRFLSATPAQAEAAGFTRSDVLVMGPDGTIYLIDVVVTHQHMGCKLDQCHKSTGKAAQLAADDKLRQFRLSGDAQQYVFVPFAVESHGRLCKQAVAFLNEMGDWACGGDKGGKSRFMMSVYREISVALQVGNGLMYTKSSERLVRAQGRHFMQGAPVPVMEEALL
ncbi:MAG: reverse transcriptase domain-containing protein [Pseudomonadota bacterium]